MFFGPFLFFYALILFAILVFWLMLVWIGVISGVFQAIGLPPALAFLALLVSLLGSYVNIPVTRVESGSPHAAEFVTIFGVRYRVPVHYGNRSTVIAVNLGGAIVPVAISIYVLALWPAMLLHAAIGAAVVSPIFVPPIVAAICGWLLGGHHADVVAYVSGVMGTLVGADLLNLGKIRGLGAPVASIGGAGTFDGIFLTGIVAVLLA
jgi:uncharacterized membrane protein